MDLMPGVADTPYDEHIKSVRYWQLDEPWEYGQRKLVWVFSDEVTGIFASLPGILICDEDASGKLIPWHNVEYVETYYTETIVDPDEEPKG